jgi:membrane protein
MRIAREIFALIKETVVGYVQAGGSMLAGALAYQTIFSLSPMLILAISISGMIFTEQAVIERLVSEVGQSVGPTAADAMARFLHASRASQNTGVATSISVVLMVVFASMLFTRLKKAINQMWGIATQPGQTYFLFLRTHLLSFVMVIVVVLLLLLFMVASTTLVSINHWLGANPTASQNSFDSSNFGLTFVGFTLLFAIIFKILPDATIAWSDVLLGAAFTSMLFTLGEYLIGYYLGRISLGSAYGATSSVILILAWVYYSMQIILFGAKFTQVVSNRYGQKVRPIEKSARVVRMLKPRRKARPVAVSSESERGMPEESGD